MNTEMSACLLLQDAGVHALSNVCHVDVERISKRKPGEVVCHLSLIRESLCRECVLSS